jgi:hypothetical protein
LPPLSFLPPLVFCPLGLPCFEQSSFALLRATRLLQTSKPSTRSERSASCNPFRVTQQRWSMVECQPFEVMLRGVSPAGRPTPSMLHSQLSTTVGDARCLPYRLSVSDHLASCGPTLPAGTAIRALVPAGTAIRSLVPAGTAIRALVPAGTAAIGALVPAGTAIRALVPAGTAIRALVLCCDAPCAASNLKSKPNYPSARLWTPVV